MPAFLLFLAVLQVLLPLLHAHAGTRDDGSAGIHAHWLPSATHLAHGAAPGPLAQLEQARTSDQDTGLAVEASTGTYKRDDLPQPATACPPPAGLMALMGLAPRQAPPEPASTPLQRTSDHLAPPAQAPPLHSPDHALQQPA